MVVEAKKEDLKAGLGQCIAEMVAVQKINQAKGRSLRKIYGSITSGTAVSPALRTDSDDRSD